jgi:hypothetical protein
VNPRKGRRPEIIFANWLWQAFSLVVLPHLETVLVWSPGFSRFGPNPDFCRLKLKAGLQTANMPGTRTLVASTSGPRLT